MATMATWYENHFNASFNVPGRPQEEECKTVIVTKRRDLIWVKKCSKRAFLKAQVSFSSWKIIYLLVNVRKKH